MTNETQKAQRAAPPVRPGARRADWDTYFLELARQAATRSSCTFANHGSLIVSKRRIRSTGYNGTPSGYGNCDEGGCPRGRTADQSRPCAGLHAEANAILYAAPEEREGASIYITGLPCIECAKLIANSGLREVVAIGDQSSQEFGPIREFLLNCQVRVRVIDKAISID